MATRKKTARPKKAPERAAGLLAPCLLILGLAVLSFLVASWFYHQGYLLYYGDAQAHLKIARQIVDSRTPGYAQIGTVWLPLPHALMLLLVRDDHLWRTGLAGTIPSACCFVLTGVLLFLAVRRALDSTAGAVTATLLFSLNPNILYLQSIPMTELVFFAGLMGLFYCSVVFGQTRSWWAVIGAGLFSCWASLTRYEGWFLIPFVAVYFFVRGEQRRLGAALVFSLIAGLAPLYWLGHNWWFYGDALEFYRGPYSAKAIYQRALDAHMGRYAGDHDWRLACLYLRTAAVLAVGWVTTTLGLLGAAAALLKRAFWPVTFLLLSPIFYLWSIHSSGTPIFVPTLWPQSYYNTRYALCVLPLLAFGGASLVASLPPRYRPVTAGLALFAALVPWLVLPRAESWITWKESQVNSDTRRQWTSETADFLRAHYHPGQGILSCTGDMAGAFRESGIPFRETLNEGNNPMWMAIMARPDLFLREHWIISQAGCGIAEMMPKLTPGHSPYNLVKTIEVKGSPPVEIYEREVAPPSVK